MSERETSPSPAKRSSIENLKRASRVKNSNMFAREHKQEYDPTSSPMIERPLATGRPLSVQAQGNAYGGKGLEGLRQANPPENKGTPVRSPLRSPLKMNGLPEVSNSPAKGQVSPTKSSLSSKSRYAQSYQPFDPENGIWSDEEDSYAERELPPGKSLHRHAKSVTFDAAPPQVNEYEMTTPDPSSVASGSREGSYDSVDNDEDESFEQESSVDHDDSFDASLEDTEKTPVVLPEDWRFMSPAVANEDLASQVESPFDGERSSPAPTARPSSAVDARGSPTRTESADSLDERRPLPPLPALGMPTFPRARSDSNSSLSNTVDRVSSAQRIAPSPPRPASVSKAEIQGMGGCSMPIEERLRLMMLQDDDKPNTVAEEQQELREKRLRRGSSDRSPEPESRMQEAHVHEEVENDDVADLGDYKMPPRISRESILRKVKSRNFDEPDDDYSAIGLDAQFDIDGISTLDPDVPIPSLESETVEKEIIIKQEPMDEDDEIDVYSIPDLYNQQLQAESYMTAIEKLEAFQESSAAANQKDDDDESHYSVDSKEEANQAAHSDGLPDEEGPPTPRALPTNDTIPEQERKKDNRMSLPQFAALLGESDFGFGMESFMTPSPPVNQEPEKPSRLSKPSWSNSPPIAEQPRESNPASFVPTADYLLERPVTPEAQLQPPRFPGQGTESDDEPKTPDSVIRYPVADVSVPDSPGVPEPVATIKAPGGRLKTRPSVTPADIEAMAEVRRQVSSSSNVPAVPIIPDQHLKRPSVAGEVGEPEADEAGETGSMKSSDEKDLSRKTQRKSSLLPLEVPVDSSEDLGFGIEDEFDRVIEAQKVAFTIPSPKMAAQAWSPGCAEYVAGQGFRPIREGYANKTFRTQKGYLMRQNTKVIVASSASHESTETTAETQEGQEPIARGTRSAGNSPRKPSASHPWTAEPWNGKVRRKSIRKSGGVPSKPSTSGPVPPLPGQQSNVASALDSVTEDQTLETNEEIGEDGERGRLFVKVVKVKDLDLPLPKGELFHEPCQHYD